MRIAMLSPRSFLVEQLSAEHSKAQTIRLVRWINQDQDRLSHLMDIFLGTDYRLTQRSAWVVRYVGEETPALLVPWLSQLVATLRRPGLHNAVQRNILNIFEHIDLPAVLLDDLADNCFLYLADPQAPIAVRAASITILDKICRQVPELRPEFHLLLEEHMDHATAAFKSRARKILGK